MSRLTKIEAQHSSEIREASDRFGDHENMTAGRVLNWIAQFADNHLPLAIKVLKNIKYYASSNIRAMTRELIRIVMQEFQGVDQQRIVFVPVGPPGSGSTIMVRVLRDLKEFKGVKVASMADLERLEPEKLSAIVFMDDLSGTGDQLSEWWENVEPLVRPKRVRIVVALLVMFSRARLRINEFAEDALCVDELDERENVLSSQNTQFDEAERKLLHRYCRRTGCPPKFERGYGACGLLLAFKHGCPNNSLPILWFGSEKWHALFVRRAI